MNGSMPKSWLTKIKLFQAALALLNDNEVEDITIRAIAKKADVSIGTFYYYYKTKYDVFYDSHQFMDYYFENVVATMLPDSGAWNQLQYFFQQYHYYNTQRTPFKLYRLILTHDIEANHNMKLSYGMQRVLFSIIDNARKNKEITSTETTEEIGLFFLTCMRSCYRHWAVNDNRCDIVKMSHDMIIKLLSIYLPIPLDVSVFWKTEAGQERGDDLLSRSD